MPDWIPFLLLTILEFVGTFKIGVKYEGKNTGSKAFLSQ